MAAPGGPLQSWLDEFAAVSTKAGVEQATDQLIARLTATASTATAWQSAGQSLFDKGYFRAAVRLLDAAIRRHPEQLHLHYWRGNALRMHGDLRAAESELRAVLGRDAAHRDAALSLAFMLRERGRIDSAAATIVALWQARKRELDIAIMAMEFLRDSGAHPQAGEIARYAADAWPGDARVNALAGQIVLALGDFAAARAMLRRALDLDPAQHSAWLRLAWCQQYVHADDADIHRFRAALIDASLGPAARVSAGFALGKALDDLGQFDSASTVLREANAAAAAAAVWDAQLWRRFVDAQIAAPALPRIDYDPGFTPVFIIGLPRSGTTLVATRLARHANVRDRGELNWIAAMHAHLQTQQQLHDPGALIAVAGVVAAQMRRDDAPARHVIDKNPLNFRYLNLIAALFPDAHIIHCVRSARDTALSLWQQHFAHDDMAFSYRFDWIREYMTQYERLIAHWRSSLGLAWMDLGYEAMVADEASESQRLAQFLQIAEATPDAHATARVITTASVWQARQATHSRSVARWKNYAAYLPELERMFPA